MARKVRGFERVLDAPALFTVAYDEIGSSIYFALGIVAAQALGLTPVVLLATGLLFLVVSLSYAEGTAAIPETGGAATFTRRAFNDLVGFATGWALLLDYLIVIALSTLFLPHYLAAALAAPSLSESPWDVVIAVAVIAAVIAVRLARHTRIHRTALVLALLDLAVQLLVVVLGFAIVFSPEVLTSGFDLAPGQRWHDLLFALPLAMLAYTGLETVANLAEETREPGKTLPRSLFSSIGLVVIMTVLIAVVGVCAFPAEDGSTDLADEWLQAPIVGIVTAFDGHLPDPARRRPARPRRPLRRARPVRRRDDGDQRAARGSRARWRSTGCCRASSAGSSGARSSRARRSSRSGCSPSRSWSLTGIFAGDDAAFLASAYSFGVLFAFTAAQLAVIRLRKTEPDLDASVPGEARGAIRGVLLPVPALDRRPDHVRGLGARADHAPGRAVRRAGLAARSGSSATSSSGTAPRGGRVSTTSIPSRTLPPGAEYRKILVPMKLGDIGEEMVATAIALAKERGATVEAVFVVRVPRAFPLEGAAARGRRPAGGRVARRGARPRRGERHRDRDAARSAPARSDTRSSTRPATGGADLIVLGSSPRWRRQSRFFSPTVDHILRHAPCEVLVVAFPEGVFEETA